MSKIRILVVDTSKTERANISRFLEQAGWLTEHAIDGLEALKKLSLLSFDVVVTDVALPHVNGQCLIETFHHRHPTLPIVLTAARECEEVAVATLRRGAAGYVRKWQLTVDLVPTIRSLLELTRPLREHKRLLTAMRACHVDFCLGNDPHDILAVARQVEMWLDGLALFEPSVRLQVSVSLREVLTNALFHGNLELSSSLKDIPGAWEDTLQVRLNSEPYRSRQTHVSVHLDSTEARFCVTDDGLGFDVEALSPKPNEEVFEQAHGRGLLLVHSFMDEVTFSGCANSVTIRKRA